MKGLVGPLMSKNKNKKLVHETGVAMSLDYIVAISLEHKRADCSWLSNLPEQDASQGQVAWTLEI